MYDYGARFYDPTIGRFWTQDAFAEKYEWMSPFQYGLNNPILMIDINGDSVAYNSFKDRLFVLWNRLTNPQFQKDYNILKNSEEMYIFKGSNKLEAGTGTFETDGKNLIMNYSFQREKDRQSGLAFTGALSHEARHGVQFENGQIGFEFNESKNKWDAVNHDIYDEVDAYNAQFFKGYNHNGDYSFASSHETFRKKYNDAPNEPVHELLPWCKRNMIKATAPRYKKLPETRLNNAQISQRVKNDNLYMRPYKN